MVQLKGTKMTLLSNQTGRLEAGGDDGNRTRDLMRDRHVT